jgi:hypothetical protein
MLRVLEPALRMKAQTPTAEVGKILFAENLAGEKRRERLHIGECRGEWGFIAYLHCLIAGDAFQMQTGIS